MEHKDENGVNAAYHFYRQQGQPQFSLYHFMPVMEKEMILKRQKKGNIKSINSNVEKKVYLEENIDEKPEVIFRKTEPEAIETQKESRLWIVLLLLAIGVLIFAFLPIAEEKQKNCLLCSNGVNVDNVCGNKNISNKIER